MARQRIPNRELAGDVARENLLTNGGFEIWQRGNGAFTADNVYTADRWPISKSGTDTISVTQGGTANSDVANGSQSCAAIVFNLGTGGGATSIYQYLKPSEGYQLAGRTVSVSVRVKTTTPGAVCASLYNGTSWSNGTFHTGSGAYETLTYTIAVPQGATLIGVRFPMSASCTVYIDNAMLVVGSVPSDYSSPHPADDLARCERYYQFSNFTNGMIEQAYAPAGGALYHWTPHHARMGGNTTITKVGTFSVTNSNQPAVYGCDGAGYSWYHTATAAGLAQVQGATSAYFVFEWNP